MEGSLTGGETGVGGEGHGATVGEAGSGGELEGLVGDGAVAVGFKL